MDKTLKVTEYVRKKQGTLELESRLLKPKTESEFQ